MVATQVGVRAYVAAVVVNAREVDTREVVHCTHHRTCPVVVVNAQEGWRGGAQDAVSACVRDAVVVNAPERGGGSLQIQWK